MPIILPSHNYSLKTKFFFLFPISAALATFCVFFFSCFANNVYAAGFDCNKASTSVEKMICSSADLSLLDSKLGESYKDVLRSGIDQDEIKASQRSWIAETRNKCLDVSCLSVAYEQRVNDLNQLKKVVNSDYGIKNNLSELNKVLDYKAAPKEVVFVEPYALSDVINILPLSINENGVVNDSINSHKYNEFMDINNSRMKGFLQKNFGSCDDFYINGPYGSSFGSNLFFWTVKFVFPKDESIKDRASSGIKMLMQKLDDKNEFNYEKCKPKDKYISNLKFIINEVLSSRAVVLALKQEININEQQEARKKEIENERAKALENQRQALELEQKKNEAEKKKKQEDEEQKQREEKQKVEDRWFYFKLFLFVLFLGVLWHIFGRHRCPECNSLDVDLIDSEEIDRWIGSKQVETKIGEKHSGEAIYRKDHVTVTFIKVRRQYKCNTCGNCWHEDSKEEKK